MEIAPLINQLKDIRARTDVLRAEGEVLFNDWRRGLVGREREHGQEQLRNRHELGLLDREYVGLLLVVQVKRK